MSTARRNDILVTEIMKMDRASMTRALLGFEGRVRMDFTEEYLRRQRTEWLRHVLLAATLYCGK